MHWCAKCVRPVLGAFSLRRGKLKVKFSIKSLVRPAKKPASAAEINSEFDAWINSPEFAEECRKAEEKEERSEERRLAREAN